MIALFLITYSCVVNAKPKLSSTRADTLIISTSRNVINSVTDSLLQLEVVLKNDSKIPIRNFGLYSNSRGEICLPPFWSIIITKVDTNQQYEPPLLLCHGIPEGFLRKNEEYRYNLKMNFKWVFKRHIRSELNRDYGEYSIQLLFKTKTEVINSNTIKILYKEN
jgi:hypothetical protein